MRGVGRSDRLFSVFQRLVARTQTPRSEIESLTRFLGFEPASFLGDRRFEKSVIEVRDEPVLAARTLLGGAGHWEAKVSPVDEGKLQRVPKPSPSGSREGDIKANSRGFHCPQPVDKLGGAISWFPK
jgi:hypothetical protein